MRYIYNIDASPCLFLACMPPLCDVCNVHVCLSLFHSLSLSLCALTHLALSHATAPALSQRPSLQQFTQLSSLCQNQVLLASHLMSACTAAASSTDVSQASKSAITSRPVDCEGPSLGSSICCLKFKLVIDGYSTPGRRITWGPVSQPGVLNFLNSSRFAFLSAVMKAVQRTRFISRTRCRTMSFRICSYLHLSSQECS